MIREATVDSPPRSESAVVAALSKFFSQATILIIKDNTVNSISKGIRITPLCKNISFCGKISPHYD